MNRFLLCAVLLLAACCAHSEAFAQTTYPTFFGVSTPVAAPTVANPTASPVVGTYSGTQSVTLSDSTSGATILYCSDTVNTCTPAATYSTVISQSATGYIRAQGTKAGYTSSAVVSFSYTIVSGTLRYVAASAGSYSSDSGPCTAYAAPGSYSTITVATFNATTQSAGDVNYICGTITASAGASAFLSLNNGGSCGSNVAIKFDTGAVLTAPYWGSNGAIFVASNYVTLDGGTNGQVTATANGSSLTYQQSSVGVRFFGVSGCSALVSEIKNLTVPNQYVNNGAGTDENDQSGYGIQWQDGNYVRIDNNTVHDVRTGIIRSYAAGATTTNTEIDHNTVYNVNWGVIEGDDNTNGVMNAPNLIHDNVIHDFALWDDASNLNHHDGIYPFATNSGSALNSATIYNNHIYGDPGTHTNTFIFVSANTGGNTCTGVVAFNNLLVNGASTTARVPANGFIQDWCTNSLIANNTMVGVSGTDPTTGNVCVSENVGTGLTLENNICSTVHQGIYLNNGGTVLLTASDYNDWYNLSYTGGDNSGIPYATLANWVACTTNGCPASHDTDSIATNPNLNGSYVPNVGSPVLGTGANLYSTFGCASPVIPGLGAGCSDAAGNARPNSAWTMGALN